jgi:hypothetical protein
VQDTGQGEPLDADAARRVLLTRGMTAASLPAFCGSCSWLRNLQTQVTGSASRPMLNPRTVTGAIALIVVVAAPLLA